MRSRISFRMGAAISACWPSSLPGSASNQASASRTDRRTTSATEAAAIFTDSASGFRRAPRQVSQGWADW